MYTFTHALCDGLAVYRRRMLPGHCQILREESERADFVHREIETFTTSSCIL